MNKFATISVQMDFDEQRVKDLLCCAFEGGSNYWCEVEKTHLSPFAEREMEAHTFCTHEMPFLEGCDLILKDATGENDGPEQPWILNREKLVKGLQVMADKYPKHFNDFVAENEDADTGDAYLQCCLFGEIVFG